MRYWKPWRRFLFWISDHVPEHIDGMIMDYLYPPRMIVGFTAKEEDLRA